MQIFKLLGTIAINNDAANKALDETKHKASDTGKETKSAFAKIGSAAATVGKSRPAVANAMRLLTLDESVREAVKDGRLSAGHARALLPLPAARQREAAEAIAAQGLSVRQTEALVKRLTTEKKEREPSIEEITHKLHAHIAEEELAQSLGRGVKIVAGRKKGRIELDYYDMDDLNDLLDALGTLQQRKNGGTKK